MVGLFVADFAFSAAPHSNMDYFQNHNPTDYEPSAILSAYKSKYPDKDNAKLHDKIKKDLAEFKRQCIEKAERADIYLKNWKAFTVSSCYSKTI